MSNPFSQDNSRGAGYMAEDKRWDESLHCFELRLNEVKRKIVEKGNDSKSKGYVS